MTEVHSGRSTGGVLPSSISQAQQQRLAHVDTCDHRLPLHRSKPAPLGRCFLMFVAAKYVAMIRTDNLVVKQNVALQSVAFVGMLVDKVASCELERPDLVNE